MTSLFAVLVAVSSVSFGVEYDAQPNQPHTAPFSVAGAPLEQTAAPFSVSYVEHWERYAPSVAASMQVQSAER